MLHGFFPLLGSESHFFVRQKTLIQQTLNGISVHSMTNEDDLLPSVLILILRTIRLGHVGPNKGLGLGSLPELGHQTHPGAFGPDPQHIPRLLPTSDDIVRCRNPEESLAPQQLPHEFLSPFLLDESFSLHFLKFHLLLGLHLFSFLLGYLLLGFLLVLVL